jgi:hypothetical protein
MVIYKAHDTHYMSERHDQKLVVFMFSGHFRERLSTVLGFRGDFQGPWHLVHVWHAWPKTHFSCVYGRFRELLPTILGFSGNLQGIWQSVHVWEAWPKTHHFYVLGPFSWAIVHSFGFLRWFTRPMTLSLCFRGMTKNLSFLHFRAVFVSYSP